MSPGGRMRFQLNAAPASVWRLEGSPDLYHWGNCGLLTNPAGVLEVTNTPCGKRNSYFYRAISP